MHEFVWRSRGTFGNAKFSFLRKKTQVNLNSQITFGNVKYRFVGVHPEM